MGTQRVKQYQEPEEAKKEKEKKDGGEEKPKGVFRKAKTRGKKWQQSVASIEENRTYSLSEALELVKKTSFAKFDAKVEVHIRLNPKKGQTVRGMLNLPHSTGKEVKVEIFNPELVKSIEKGKIDYDILLARPEDMSQLVKVAKILGPKGLMPNPKSGTILDKPEEAVKKFKSGQIEYKADAGGNIHQIIGKVSFDNKKLEENFTALLEAVRQYNPASGTICATMGPGIKVAT